MKRRLIGVASALGLLCTFVPTAFASQPSYHVGGKKAISVNGQVQSNPYILVASDAGNSTSYMGVWYLGQAIQAAGGDYTWDPDTKTFSISTPPGEVVTQFNIPSGVGTGDTTLIVNGVVVKKFNSFSALDPAGGSSETTFMPLYYLGEVFSQLDGSSWDGNTFSFSNFAHFSISGNNNLAVGQKEVLFMNENGMVLSGTIWSVDGNRNGNATIDNYGNFSASAPGTYTITAKNGDNTATATVVVYGTPAGVVMSAASPTVVANNVSTDTVTVKVIDSTGTVVPNFNGYVTVAYTSGGDNGGVTFYDPVSGTRNYGTSLSNVLITNGIGTFSVKANANVSVTDTFSVSSVYSSYGTLSVGQVNNTSWTYGTVSIGTTAQVATSIKVTADHTTLYTTYSWQPDRVYAEVDDQTGNPMISNSYPITFTVSGSGATFSGQSTTSSTGWGYTSGFQDAQATLDSVQGASGTLTVTATSGSLTGSLNLTASVT